MSAVSGSLSYARFFVPSKLPRDFRDTAHDAICANAIRPLHPDEAEEMRAGWCVMGENVGLELPYERVMLDGFVNLGLRIDKWTIPGALLRTRVREAETKYREKSGKERLSKREKIDVREIVVRELRRRLVPTVRVYDLSWSLEDGLVRFFSHSEKVTGTMLDLFAQTFGVELVPESPFTLARRLGLTDEQQAAWESIEMTLLTRAEGE